MKNVIEINGRQYDAITGRLLNGNSINKPSSSQRKNTNPIKFSGANIDGVNRKKDQHQPITKAKINPPTTRSKSPPRPKKQEVSKIIDGLRKKPQKSVTLSRKFVKKPVKKNSPSAVSTVVSPAKNHLTTPEKQSSSAKLSVFRKVPEAKLAKAISFKTSSAISKFSKATATHKPAINPHLKVKKAPSEAPKYVQSSISSQSKNKQKLSVFGHHTVQPISKNQVTNLERGQAHKIKPYHKKTHSKVRTRRYLIGLATAGFALLLFVGFLAYQKVPQIAVKVAARNAGFDVKVPGNIPSGYGYKSPISISKDSLTIEYKSNTDKRSFQITQKPSSWTSESLLSNYLIEGKKQYQAYYNKGMTVFIYDNNNATWVDKGVWFTLNANGSLSSDQILSIASSI